MSKLAMFATFLAILAVASEASAQKIGMAFDEAGTVFYIDGRSDLVPNPDFSNFPSAIVWVIAYDSPELSGYEYNLTSTDVSAIASTPIIYPSEGSDFAALPGDVRVDTGICFQAGGAEAGPDPTHIRLAKHQFSWFSPPTVDVLYCINPSQASVNLSGATAPQYTECVSNPVSLPFAVANEWDDYCTPDGCVPIVFEWEPDGVTMTSCQRIPSPAASTSWGALKAAY
jgi:hypothetical protein